MKKFIVVLTVFMTSLLFSAPALAYTVKSGDTISKIAMEHNLSLQELEGLNPQIKNLDKIYVGQNIQTSKFVTAVETKVKDSFSQNTPPSKDEIDLRAEYVREQTLNELIEEREESDAYSITLSADEKDLLARLVRAEAQTEPYEGKIAVACVVLNRIESSKFPNTIKGVIYAPRQFQPVSNGEINKPADEESIKAVEAALTEQRQLAPGALFFYNPSIATSRWLDSRTTTLVIGQHIFKK